MIDIVLVRESEVGFAEFAKHLGYSDVLFVFRSVDQALASDAKKKGVLVEPKDISKVKKLGLLAFCHGSREAIERGADVVFGFEVDAPKDKMHYREGGLNQVLCQLAHDNKVAIGFSLASLLQASPAQRALYFGRIAQNVELCRKYKVEMRIGSFAASPFGLRGAEDVVSLFTQLGMSREEAVKAFS